jgi:hypothetical protein
MDILKLIREYIANSNTKGVGRFINLQEREVWLTNNGSILNSLTIEQLNSTIDIVDYEKDSGKFFMRLYSDKLSEIVKDMNIQELTLMDIYNEIEVRTNQFRTNARAIQLINNIIGSSISNYLRLYKDDEIIDFIKRDTDYNIIIYNFMSMVMKQYQESKGKISYGISEYTLKAVLNYASSKMNPTQ